MGRDKRALGVPVMRSARPGEAAHCYCVARNHAWLIFSVMAFIIARAKSSSSWREVSKSIIAAQYGRYQRNASGRCAKLAVALV